MAASQPSLKGRALRLLSGREYSRAELERKLVSFEEVPGSLAQALDALQAKGFISEQRVIESVLNRRAGKLGGARLRQELQGKGLDPDLVSAALAQMQGSEGERALAVWRKKFGVPPADTQAAARQMRFLATRGFATETIRRVVSGRLAEDVGMDMDAEIGD
jgi:regulatory protein